MPTRILAEVFAPPSRRWYTTGDAARALQVTAEGVRYFAREGLLPCTRTPGGYRLFAEGDVAALVVARSRARLRSVTALRRRKLGARGGPRQLSLLSPRLHLVGRPITWEGSSRSRAIGRDRVGCR